MTTSSYRAWGIALALIGVVASAVWPILLKLAYAYVTDPVTLIALRMVFSLPFFVAMAFWVRRDTARTPLTRRDWQAVLLLGFLGYYLASFFGFLGLQYIAAGLGRLVLFLYPTITVLLSALFLGKYVSRRDIVALVICYAGLALVLSQGFAGENRNLMLGALLVFGSALCYAVYLVSSSRVVTRIGSMRFTAYATSVASLLCILQFLLLRPLSALQLPPQVYGLAIAMAVGCTVLPVLVTSEALRRIGANQVAIIGAAGPVTTIFLGWIGLEESMSLLQMAGAALVLAGVLLVTIKPGKTQEPRRQEMDMGLRGKTALVCASSKGLGRGCAFSLAREGVNLVITARGKEALEQTAQEIRAAAGVKVETVACDITTEAGRKLALTACPNPDILINNAGGPPPGDFRNWTRDTWIAALDANMLTPIELIKATVDGMIARKFGRIVNITSSSVKAPIEILGLSNGARSGLTGFVAGIARKTVAHNVTINNLLPGSFDTDRIRTTLTAQAKTRGVDIEVIRKERMALCPAGRFGDPAEFGDACAYLCSAQAGYVTGQNFLIDGGSYPGTY